MATLQELQNAHEEILERLGQLIALFQSINGEEPAEVRERMCGHARNGRAHIIQAVSALDELIELKREAEGP